MRLAMLIFLPVCALALFGVIVISAVDMANAKPAPANAVPARPSDSMEPLDAKRLEAAFLRVQLLRTAIERAQKDMEGPQAIVDSYVKRFALQDGSDVNFETGKITRPAPTPSKQAAK